VIHPWLRAACLCLNSAGAVERESRRDRLHRKQERQLRDMLSDLFVLDPKHRSTASQALRAPYFDRQS